VQSCGSPSCFGFTLTSIGSCDGTGTCLTGSSAPCPGGFICADSTSCDTFCGTDSDCADGTTYCSGGACVPKGTLGACTSDDQCLSGLCGTTGVGNCCNAPCNGSGVCGASDCDTSGACVYTPAGTSCGANQGCNGSVFTTATSCDGAGTCATGNSTDCAAIGDVCDDTLGCVQCISDSDCLAVNDAGTESCMNNICQ
jgi:hypothetical protein